MRQTAEEKIKQFIHRIEQDLQTIFERSQEGDIITLESKQLDLSIYVYLPKTINRLPSRNSRTIHIDYDQLLTDFDKICARLTTLYGKGEVIYARKTVVARVDKRNSLAFVKEHHLQMPLAGKYRYGLFHEGELVSIAIFSGGRHMRDKHEDYRSFELIRFCHKSGYRIVGGLSKLLKAFTRDFRPNDIMTYVDRDWSQDSSLRTLGFEERGTIPPQPYWITEENRRIIKAGEEGENLLEKNPNGYLSHNSGSTKLVLTL